ncbi:MAG: hypothetical protein HY077_15705 [Elusimicrobia bacterium]|nr:hypothetical protein [Elusimicrobiota bacterium]
MRRLRSRETTDLLLALLAFVLLPAGLFLLADHADPDLWWHLRTGRLIWETRGVPRADTFSFSAAGAPWVDHEWGFEALAYALYRLFGPFGLFLLKAAALGALLWLVHRLISSRAKALSVRVCVFSATSFVVLSLGSSCRPQLFTYLGCAALSLWPAAWLLVPWSWLHGGFLAGACLLLIFSFGRRPASPGLGGTLVAIAATAVNPYGLGLWRRVIDTLFFVPLRESVTEWQSVWSTAVPGYRVCFLLYAAALAAGWLWHGRRRAAERASWLAAAAGLAAGLVAVRHLPLLAILAAAPLAGALEALRAAPGLRPKARAADGAFFLGLNAALLCVVFLVASWALYWLPIRGGIPLGAIPAQTAEDAALGPRPGVVLYPKGAVRFIKENGLSARLMNPIETGGYLLWHLYPQCKVFIDTRMDQVYGEEQFRAYVDFAQGGPGAQSVLAKYEPDLVLHDALDLALPLKLTGLGWGIVYRDPDYLLMARRSGPFARLVKDYAQYPVIAPRSALPWLFP